MLQPKRTKFRKAHKGAHANNDLYVGHPEFEGFITIIQFYSCNELEN